MLHVGDIVTIDRQPNIPLGESGRVMVPTSYLGKPMVITIIDTTSGVCKYKFHGVRNGQPHWLEEDLTLVEPASKRPLFGIGDRVRAVDIYRVLVAHTSDAIQATTCITVDTTMTIVGVEMRLTDYIYILKPDECLDARFYDSEGQPPLLLASQSILARASDYTLF